MKAIAVQSSPNLNGLTSSPAQAVLKGVEAEAGETNFIHLNRLDIKPCIACDKDGKSAERRKFASLMTISRI